MSLSTMAMVMHEQVPIIGAARSRYDEDAEGGATPRREGAIEARGPQV